MGNGCGKLAFRHTLIRYNWHYYSTHLGISAVSAISAYSAWDKRFLAEGEGVN